MVLAEWAWTPNFPQGKAKETIVGNSREEGTQLLPSQPQRQEPASDVLGGSCAARKFCPSPASSGHLQMEC